MKAKVLVAALALLMSVAGIAQTGNPSYEVSPSRYDYSPAARQITEGCTDKYDQVKAIYRWLCANISYDTSYTIYTADECWDNQRGVCQAYCELFYRLAEPLGIDVHVITGTSKNELDPAGSHAWLFVVVEDGAGILIDPTWGAGSVNGKTFIRNENDMSWFHVDPYWMIFTHFPDDATYQFLPTPIARERFDSLPIIKPVWGEYGCEAEAVFNRCMAGHTDFPKFYKEGVGYIRLVNAPMEKTLRVGQVYTFAFQKLADCEVALINEDFYTNWRYRDGIYSMDFMPAKPGEVSWSIQKKGEKHYWSVVEYEVPNATRADLANLERRDPMLMPEIARLRNMDAGSLRRYGIDGKRLLAAVRSGEVKALPQFYNLGDVCTIDEIPLNETLRVGNSYTFSIRSRDNLSWAVINEGDWYRSWSVDSSTGAMRITVVPQKAGDLKLSVQRPGDDGYLSCVKYTVR